MNKQFHPRQNMEIETLLQRGISKAIVEIMTWMHPI